MAVKRKKKSRLRRAVKGGLSRLRKATRAPHDDPPRTLLDTARAAERPVIGSHRLDPESWRLPSGLAEAGETEARGWLPGPLVSALILLAVAFILIIAVLVSHMPQPPQ